MSTNPFLEALIYGVRDLIDSAGNTFVRRSKVKFTNATIVDNPTTDTTEVTMAGGSSAVADDIAKHAGTNIDRVIGMKGVPFLTPTGGTPADLTKPPRGGAWIRNQAFGVDGFRAKNGTPDGYFDPTDYGAIGDGASHPLSGYFGSLGAAQAVFPHATSLTNELDWAAIQAAINDARAYLVVGSLNLFGGHIHFGRGTFVCDQPLDCTALRGLSLIGTSGRGYGGGTTFEQSQTILSYTGTGPRFIDARSASCLLIDRLNIQYQSRSFVGHLVDCAHIVAPDTFGVTLRHSIFSGGIAVDLGSGDHGAASLVRLHGNICATIDSCTFVVADVGILGIDNKLVGPQSGYSNAITVSNCEFGYMRKPIANLGQEWHIHGCTFEGLGGFQLWAIGVDTPDSQADMTDTFTFSTVGPAGSGGDGTITRAGPGSFVADGWKIGNTLFALNCANPAGNGYNVPITGVDATHLYLEVNTFTVGTNTITRTDTHGDFVRDGWQVGMQPVGLGLNDAGLNVTLPALINVTASTLTFASTLPVTSVTETQGSLIHPAPFDWDAYTPTSTGYGFGTPETSTSAHLFYKQALATATIQSNWMGDIFTTGPWLFGYDVGPLQITGNYFSDSSGAGKVLVAVFGATGIHYAGNYTQESTTPLQLGDSTTISYGAIDGVCVQGNSAYGGSYVSWPTGLGAQNVQINGNASANVINEYVIDGDHTFAFGEHTLEFSVAGKTATLPPNPWTGMDLTVIGVDEGTGGGAPGGAAYTIDGNGKNINGAATYTQVAKSEVNRLVYNGTEWRIDA